MNEEIIAIGNDDRKKMDDSYVYGTYPAMDWLINELIGVAAKILEGAKIEISDSEKQIHLLSVEEFLDWVEIKFPETKSTILNALHNASPSER